MKRNVRVKRSRLIAGSDQQRRNVSWAVLLLSTVALGLSGCRGFWEDVTSNDFRVHAVFERPPDPFLVLEKSKAGDKDAKYDGDQRARALKALREPKQSGGSDKDQDHVLNILTYDATRDSRVVCRLAAIEALGRFKDPRAIDALQEAYRLASAFPPEHCTIVRCQALTALGNTRNPRAIPLLAEVVAEPPLRMDPKDRSAPAVSRQQQLNYRIAAARALGQFRDPKAAEVLQRVLQTEQDVAMHNRLRESLEACSGTRLPPDEKPRRQLQPQPADINLVSAREQRTDPGMPATKVSPPPACTQPPGFAGRTRNWFRSWFQGWDGG